MIFKLRIIEISDHVETKNDLQSVILQTYISNGPSVEKGLIKKKDYVDLISNSSHIITKKIYKNRKKKFVDFFQSKYLIVNFES